ncbi:hypothetical protein M409DRAFT_17618 [Zasmidium cellare ATCC 36951]|uniref:Large ribosomal subunit protein bL21m n=1 Tax=Zasmidium cellare ATCC 36951 TaxID=1080233 RepID=A0A6A6D045_ZASCE|nr:uncharacterized protein M409DRAFT_17618 [Zasmidium cellare ATCC 36951]KAF2172383.1 hypothetical protein M409DRAFT_17618 [Zasmidium cellare ATCC 36951]
MLSKTLKRTLLETPSQWPPTFLLPWAANLPTRSFSQVPAPKRDESPTSGPAPAHGRRMSTAISESPSEPKPPPPSRPSASKETSSQQPSSSLSELLPLLRSQGPHYITLHIHGKPYLVTQGDTVRLPFLMHGVGPGDVLRLNRAINLGSREYTLKAPAASPKLKSPTTSTVSVLDPTTGSLPSHSRVMPSASLASSPAAVYAPHYIPHIAKGKHSYLDEKLFVCRAVVMGVESEPMRTKEKTKRRQRHIKTVKSKHRFTVLKIKELRIESPEQN